MKTWGVAIALRMMIAGVQIGMQEAQGNWQVQHWRNWRHAGVGGGVAGGTYEEVNNKGCSSYINMDDPRYGKPGRLHYKIAQMQSSACMEERLQGPIFSFMKTVSIAACLRMIAKRVQMGMQEARGNCTSLLVKLTRCCVVTTWLTYSIRVNNKGCSSYVHMDDGRYNKSGGNYKHQISRCSPAPAWGRKAARANISFMKTVSVQLP